MAQVAVRNLEKRYGESRVVCCLSFEVDDGELFCLLGPPEAGKTTVFRIISGLEEPDAGEVMIDGEDVGDVPPQRRDVAMVFEDSALYPHMTAYGNISHSLYLRHMDEGQIRRHVDEIAELLRITHLLERHPETYSGGERRRVALARAMVRRPRLLLLDQALSDLDAKLRQEMAGELKRLQLETGQTMIYATHDFEEAVAIADRCLVLRDGQEIQTAEPQTLYERPVNAFVGALVGSPSMNLIRCRAEPADGSTVFTAGDLDAVLDVSTPISGPVLLGLRPEDLYIIDGHPDGAIRGRVEVVQERGLERIIDIRVDDDIVVKLVTPKDTHIERDQEVSLSTPGEAVFVFDPESGERLLPREGGG